MQRTRAPLHCSGKVFVGCGFWLIGLGAYFLFLRPALLPEELRFIGSTLAAIRAAAPGLEGWLSPVFNVMGGFLIATGSMTVLVASRLRRSQEHGTLTALTVAGTADVALIPGINRRRGAGLH